MKTNILLLLSLCLVTLSCQKETIPSLTVNQTEVAVTDGGGFQVVSFESNTNWTAKSSESWCTIYPASGDASTKSTTVTVSTNDSYDARSCTVTIMAGGLSKSFKINQSANKGLLVTKDKYELNNDASTIEVEVKANVDFEIDISDDWITKVTTRGLSSNKISFNIAQNKSYDNRQGSITIKQKDGALSNTIKVFQSQKDAIILSKKKEDLSSDKQTLKVELKTNVDFEVIIPSAAKSWVSYTSTRALRTETLLLEIATNYEYEARTTEVYVKNKATSLQDTLTIVQDQSISLPTLRGSEVTEITGTSAKYGGIISDDGGAEVTNRGVCWSTVSNPTIALSSKTSNGTGIGTFFSSMTGLTPGTNYYLRAFATNLAGTSYGNEVSFMTSFSAPIVTTSAITSITSITATGGGNIIVDGGKPVTARGVCWSTTPNPTIDMETKTLDGHGIGAYSSYITGLSEGTKYYVRAYSVNAIGVSYDKGVQFTTKNGVYEVEYNDEMIYANLLTEGIKMNFSLNTLSDIDWFKIFVPAGKMLNYKIEIPEGINGLWRIITYNSNMVQGNSHNWSNTVDSSYPVNKSDYYYFKIFVNEEFKFLYNNSNIKLTVTLSDWY